MPIADQPQIDDLWREYRRVQINEGRRPDHISKTDFIAGVRQSGARMGRFDAFSSIHTDLQILSVNQQIKILELEAELKTLRADNFRLLGLEEPS